MFGWLDKIRARYHWSYVATVPVRTDCTDKGAVVYSQHARILLYERGDGKRRKQMIGDGGESLYAIKQRAAALAWIDGGPLPAVEDIAPARVPEAKPTAKLVAFPGGKQAD